jgi:stress-induced morphogen
MTTTTKRNKARVIGKSDAMVDSIRMALETRFLIGPELGKVIVKRYSPVSIHVRIVSEQFRAKSLAEREENVMRILKALGKQANLEISVLVMETPDEAAEGW